MAWPGPAQGRSDGALALLRVVSREVQFDTLYERLRPSVKSTSRDWALPSVLPPFVNEELDPIAALFGRPCFTRV